MKLLVDNDRRPFSTWVFKWNRQQLLIPFFNQFSSGFADVFTDEDTTLDKHRSLRFYFASCFTVAGLD